MDPPRTLAELQQAPDSSAAACPPDGSCAPLPQQLPLQVERVRTFDTPEFRGMTFLEVESKTALNRVRGMPFQWSINPYRGCSHACSYCLAGDTPILMADGRTKPLADVQVGDQVYGTVREGRYRRSIPTRVLDHWTTTKPAYRITLADGSEIVASGDHRFLTSEGWRHVLPSATRPHCAALEEGSALISVGPLAPPVQQWLARANTQKLLRIEPIARSATLYDITTGTGDFIANGLVSHNCFARPTHEYLNLSPLADFERTVVVKTNVGEVLRRELARPSWRGEHVAMGTNTDPYQRAEGRYALMPGIIGALTEALTPFSILTKGTLVTRDLDALAEAAERVDARAALTIGMLDEELWRSAEPGTPAPRARLQAVQALNAAGIPTGVMLAPIMPGLNDDTEQLAALTEAAIEAGAEQVTPIVLHLRPGVREVFLPWLDAAYPQLSARYRSLYPEGRRSGQAPRAYRDEIARTVAEHRRAALRRSPRPRPARAWRTSPEPDAATGQPATPDGHEQLRLL